MRGIALALLLVPSLASAGDFCKFWSYTPTVNQAAHVKQQVRPIMEAEFELSGQPLNRALRCMVRMNEALQAQHHAACLPGVETAGRFPNMSATITGVTDAEGNLTATLTPALPTSTVTPQYLNTNVYVTGLFFGAFEYCALNAAETEIPDLLND